MFEDLFCWFGYGYCISEPPPPEPPEVWPAWPLQFILKSGSWEESLNFALIFHIILASFTGSLTAGIILYINWRKHFAQKENSSAEVPTRVQEASSGRPGPLGDNDDNPIAEKFVSDENYSIIDLAGRYVVLDKTGLHVRPPTRSPSSRYIPRIDSTVSVRSRITIPSQLQVDMDNGEEIGFRNSQCQILFQRDGSEANESLVWDPLVNFVSHCYEGPTETNNQTSNTPKLVLHQFQRGIFNPCTVPFGMKLETILRMCGIQYDTQFDCDNTGPWLTYSPMGECEGETIIGVQNCVKFLQKKFSDEMKSFAAPIEKKVPAWYIGVLLDFHLSWGITIMRWLEEGKEVVTSQTNFGHVFGEIKEDGEKVGKSLKNSGTVLNAIRDDLIALTASLGNKNHFIGDNLTDLDCSAFAVLSQLLWSAPGSDFEQLIRGYPSLVNYCQYIRRLLWSDWDANVTGNTELSPCENIAIDQNNEKSKKGESVSEQQSSMDAFKEGRENHSTTRTQIPTRPHRPSALPVRHGPRTGIQISRNTTPAAQYAVPLSA